LKGTVLETLPFRWRSAEEHRSNEYNRVLYLTEKEEKEYPTFPTPRLSYTPANGYLRFTFSTTYDKQGDKGWYCLEGATYGMFFPITSNTVPALISMPKQPAPLVVASPVHLIPEMWNKFMEIATNMGLQKNNIEVVAHMLRSNGISIPDAEKVLNDSVWEFKITRSRKNSKKNKNNENNENKTNGKQEQGNNSDDEWKP